jgi:hypothetical protein
MLAIVAVILFLLALLFELAGQSIGKIDAAVLTTAGLLFLALHMAGALGWTRSYRGRRPGRG